MKCPKLSSSPRKKVKIESMQGYFEEGNESELGAKRSYN